MEILDQSVIKKAKKAFNSIQGPFVIERSYKDPFTIIQGDCLEVLKKTEAESFDSCVTSPPYFGLRDYQNEAQVGAEERPDQYIQKLVDIFSEVKRTLKPHGTLWVNIGDSYSNYAGGRKGSNSTAANSSYREVQKRAGVVKGIRPKNLIGIPWMLAFALREDGWILRSDIIWSKTNAAPESVTDRPTKSHEYIFMLSKQEKYFYDSKAVREGVGSSRNRRTVWDVAVSRFSGSHFAPYPTALIEPCILAGCAKGGIVLDPFTGSGTTGVVALKHGRHFTGIELNPHYVQVARKRILDRYKSFS